MIKSENYWSRGELGIPKSHLFVQDDLPLFELAYIFSNCSVWYELNQHERIATFDLVVRDIPYNRNFLVLGGIEEIVSALSKWQYDDDSIAYLLEAGTITEGFADYLSNVRFTGDVYAMPEGTIFFPQEPVVRVTAPIIEGSLIGSFLIAAVHSNTVFTSKMIRSRIAAQGTDIVGSVSQRTHGFESSYKCGRASYLVGTAGGTAMPGFSKKYQFGMEPAINLACHNYIVSFDDELTAMREITKRFGQSAALMIDTYDVIQGLSNAIQVGQEMAERGEQLFAVIIDSGNLVTLSRYARAELDQADLKETKIIVATNLDEWKIQKIVRQKAPVDCFIVVTEVGVVTDDPKLEIVYKLAAINGKDGVKYCAKLSTEKQSYPGIKQVYRIFQDGKFSSDVVGLVGEDLGEPLLIPMIENGIVSYELPDLSQIRDYINEQLVMLPSELLTLDNLNPWNRIKYSRTVTGLLKEIRREALYN